MTHRFPVVLRLAYGLDGGRILQASLNGWPVGPLTLRASPTIPPFARIDLPSADASMLLAGMPVVAMLVLAGDAP